MNPNPIGAHSYMLNNKYIFMDTVKMCDRGEKALEISTWNNSLFISSEIVIILCFILENQIINRFTFSAAFCFLA